jgi:DNA-binding MarR family transcriptional regulator
MVSHESGRTSSVGARPAAGGVSVITDAATRDALDAIRRIVRSLRESSRASERQLGLSAAQLFVLQRLAGAPALSLNELAERTLTHQSSVSVVVTKLVRRGLVARTASAADARRVEITLTRQGRALVDRSPAAAQDRLIAGLALLGARRRRLLASSLRALVDVMALSDEHPAMFFEGAPASGKTKTKTKTNTNMKTKTKKQEAVRHALAR